MHTKTYIQAASVLAIAASLAIAAPALADTTATASVQPTTSSHAAWGKGPMGGGMRMPGVFGTVASVSGTTLTVTSKPHPTMPGAGSVAAVTYTVDASNATVMKNGTASTLSAVAVGDTVMIQGTVSGTSVTATTIRDGLVPMGTRPQGGGTSTPIITGNGEPVVAGSVTAISGSTLTITNKSNVTYTVDATNATIDKGNAKSTLASVAVGDNVVVQGTVNGTSVTASSVIDSGTAASTTSGSKKPGVMGFFAGIGGFFAHLFGF